MIRISTVATLGMVLVAAACTNPAGDSEVPGLQAAKAPEGPVVLAASPAYGHQAEQGKVVRITGSGFDNGSTARWERNGLPDPEVAVVSTQFISSTALDATINIGIGATLAFYDVAVTTSKGRKGIGTERFEVTGATAITGTMSARGANNSGQIVGQRSSGAFFWSPATGLEAIASTGIGMDVSDDGLSVVGTLGNDEACTKVGVVWTRSGGGWAQTELPRDPATGKSNANAVTSNPLTGEAMLIAGWDLYISKCNQSPGQKARLWTRSGGVWQRHELPFAGVPGYSLALDVTPDSVVAGNAGGRAGIWAPDGTGGWILQYRDSLQGDLQAITPAGTLAVGRKGNFAAYWLKVGGQWTGGFLLPGSCTYAYDVDDLGKIVMSGCPVAGANGQRTTSAVIVPPYGATNITYLGGFGNATTGPTATAISRDGRWIVGYSTLNNTQAGAYWKEF